MSSQKTNLALASDDERDELALAESHLHDEMRDLAKRTCGSSQPRYYSPGPLRRTTTNPSTGLSVSGSAPRKKARGSSS